MSTRNAPLGELERAIMETIWDSPRALVAGELRDSLVDTEGTPRDLAVTTVLTVLSRLEKKGFVTRDRSIRPHQYRAVTSRSAYVAELMHEVLGNATDREDVLARFVGQVSRGEQDVLRRMLDAEQTPSS